MKKISTVTGIVIIFAAAIVLFGAAGVYFWYANFQTSIINSQSNYNVQSSTAQIADWKTYNDSQLPFSFKYPSTWENPTKNFLPAKLDVSFSEGLFIQYGVDFNAGIPETFNEIASQIGGSSAQRANFNVNGKKAIEITCDSNECPQWLADDVLVYGDVLGNNLFISNNQGKIDSQLFKTIVSTFKFKNLVTNQTLNWKTYTNTQYGFSIQYPSDWTTENIPTDSPLYAFGNERAFCISSQTVNTLCKPIFHIEMPDGSRHALAVYALDLNRVESKYGQPLNNPNLWIDKNNNREYELVISDLGSEYPDLTPSEQTLMDSVMSYMESSFKFTK